MCFFSARKGRENSFVTWFKDFQMGWQALNSTAMVSYNMHVVLLRVPLYLIETNLSLAEFLTV